MNERFVHYLTGIENIDQQHAGLFELFFRIRDTSVFQEIRELMDKLLQDVRAHFTYEESVMTDANYPYREFHFEAHRALLQKLERTLPSLTEEFSRKHLIPLLEDALYAHIDTMDVQMTEWVRANAKA